MAQSKIRMRWLFASATLTGIAHGEGAMDLVV